MKRNAVPSRALAALVAVVLLASGARVHASPVRATSLVPKPIDYSKITGLSKPVYKNLTKDVVRLPMADGTQIYIEITRPKVSGKRFPVIAEISPYHGTTYERDGFRMLPQQGGLVKYFAPRGYAVLMMDVRGTGRSGGCLDLMGPRDQSDAKAVIEWAARQPWSNGRVGQLGHSYPGGTSVMALSQHPKGLVTVVVSAGLGSMYEHQFQGGVPYFFQWAGPYIGYSILSFERHLPVGIPAEGSGNGGDDLGNNTEYIACGLDHAPAIEGLTQLTPLDQLSGRWSPWHSARDFRPGAATNKVPVFVIHGVNDQAARVASLDWFLRRNNAADKLWIGQWDHGIGCCPNRRGWQWTNALHAWFDKQLQQRDVDTGPPFEAFLNDKPEGEQIEARQEILTAPKFNKPSRWMTLYPDGGGTMSGAPKEPSSLSFVGTPLNVGFNGAGPGAEFRTAPAPRDVVLAGLPKLRLAASVTVPRVYLIATMFDEDPDGAWRRISQCTINPELRNSVHKAEIVLPGKKYLMGPPCFSMAHHLRKGHRLLLRVTTSDPDKVPFFTVDPHITVYTGAGDTMLQVPVVENGLLSPDRYTVKPPKGSSVPPAA